MALSRDLCEILQDGLESLSLSRFQLFKAHELTQKLSMSYKKTRKTICIKVYSIMAQITRKYLNTNFGSLASLKKTSPKTTINGEVLLSNLCRERLLEVYL